MSRKIERDSAYRVAATSNSCENSALVFYSLKNRIRKMPVIYLLINKHLQGKHFGAYMDTASKQEYRVVKCSNPDKAKDEIL